MIDKSTLAETLALMAEMGCISLSDKGEDLVRKSREIDEQPRMSSNGHGNDFVEPCDDREPEYAGASDEDLFDADE